MPELRPKQDCTTRWNSTFYMLKRFLESKDAIISTLVIVNAPVYALTQEEREVVREACTVLEPFEQVTVEISAERKPISPLQSQLLHHHQALPPHHASRSTTSHSCTYPKLYPSYSKSRDMGIF
ncbi:hypothetical protein AAFF_G00391980 [Aldrovandia affinis]|uniref:Uncharacterized protein n=1 Tax=Aldrovandia affinis TaxID=143900 RepID=A0AAD7WLV9_9TELE|nr:hypothetical protein AAFF_G00391980 [Aldrovandia affinis]